MDFAALGNFLLAFFNLIADQQENNVPETRTSPKSVFLEEFNDMIEKALSPLEAITERVHALETKLKSSEVQILELKNKAVIERVDALETKLKNSEDQILELKNKAVTERVDALETKLKSSEDQILELKNKETVQVVFSVAVGRGNYHYGPHNTDKTLKFKKVITNIGNAYNKATGNFVAPYAGIYYFVFFHHAGGESGIDLYLVKEEERIVQAQNHPLVYEKAQNGGNAAFLQLKAGDHVYLSMSPETHVWASETHTTFSGFLVKRTEKKTEDEKGDS